MKGSKGMELPINTIVVVAIAVLVLVVAAALFTGQLFRQTGTIDLVQAYAQGCNTLKTAYNCRLDAYEKVTVSNYKDPNTGRSDLEAICESQFSNFKNNPKIADADEPKVIKYQCYTQCGCPVPKGATDAIPP